MAAASLTQSSALEDVLVLGRFGKSLPQGPGVTLSQIHPCEVATLIAANGKSRALTTALKKDFGIAMPTMGKSASARGVSMHATSPGQYLVVSRSVQGLAGKLDTKLGKIAAVTDQSHGRVMMAMSGPRAREVLSKGTSMDLRPGSFKPGMCAATQIGHVGVVIACTGADSFELSVFRSFAEGFWLGLSELALEWGYEVS